MKVIMFMIGCLIVGGCSIESEVQVGDQHIEISENLELITDETATLETDFSVNLEKRAAISAQIENRFFEWLEYVEQPDALTKELTEFLSYVAFIAKPESDFDSPLDADPEMILANTILYTKEVELNQFMDDPYVDEFGYTHESGILREHVEENAKNIYGENYVLGQSGYETVEYDERLQMYFIIPMGISVYNPVILEMSEVEDTYELTVVLPKRTGYGDLQYSYESLPEGEAAVSLAEGVRNCSQRKIVLKKDTEGQLTLISHHLLPSDAS